MAERKFLYKRVISVMLTFLMVMLNIPAGAFSVSAAAGTASVTLCLDTVSGKLRKNSSSTTAPEALSGTDFNGSYGWNNSTKTLSLENFSFTTTAAKALDIGTIGDGVTINLFGTNTITSVYDGDNADTFGIYSSNTPLTIEGEGSLTATGGSSTYQSYGIDVKSLTVNSGAVTAQGGAGSFSQGVNTFDGNIEITGGSLTAQGGTAINSSYGIYSSSGTVNISGGTVSATAGAGTSNSYGIYNNGGIVNITGGTLTADAGAGTTGTGIFATSRKTTINGGTVTAKGKTRAFYAMQTLPQSYKWSSSTTYDTFPADTLSTDSAYSHSTSNKSVKIETITSVTPTATFYNPVPADITVKLYLAAGEKLNSIYLNGVSLSKSMNEYTVSGNEYTIKTSTITKLASEPGDYTLKFYTTDSVNPQATITVTDSYPPYPGGLELRDDGLYYDDRIYYDGNTFTGILLAPDTAYPYLGGGKYLWDGVNDILTLDNVNITSQAMHAFNNMTGSGGKDFTVKLIGANYFKSTDNYASGGGTMQAFYSQYGKATILGPGSLTLENTSSYDGCGANASDLIILGGTVTAIGNTTNGAFSGDTFGGLPLKYTYQIGDGEPQSSDGGAYAHIAANKKVTIAVQTAIDKTTATFSKIDNPADIDIRVSVKAGYELSRVTMNNTTLIENTHYTVSGDTYTILRSFLDDLSTGNYTLKFVTSDTEDTDPTVALAVGTVYSAGLVLDEGYLTYNSSLLTENDPMLYGGSYEWDPDTNTLTLTNVEFTTTAATALDLGAADVNLVLSGTSSITSSPTTQKAVYVINSTGNITISGTGTLNITVGTDMGNYSVNGIYTSGDVTVLSGTLNLETNNTITAVGYGVHGNDITFNGGTVNIEYFRNGIKASLGKFTLNGTDLNLTGNDYALANDLYMYGGSIDAVKGNNNDARVFLTGDTNSPVVLPVAYDWSASTSSGTTSGTSNYTHDNYYKELSITAKTAVGTETVTYDTNTPADINIRLSINAGEVLESIALGEETLATDTDYTVEGDTYTIKQAAFTGLDTGDVTLKFNTSGTTDPEVTITVTNYDPARIDVYDFGAKALDPAVYNNMLTADVINSFYSGVEDGTTGVNIADFSAGDLTFEDGGYSNNHMLRTTNTALTRYDEDTLSGDEGTNYKGYLYSNYAGPTVYFSLDLEAGDKVTVVAASGDTEKSTIHFKRATTGAVEKTAEINFGDASTAKAITFYPKAAGTYRIYSNDNKLVVARIYVEHFNAVNVGGTVYSPGGSPDFTLKFTNKNSPNIAPIQAAVGGDGSYSVNLLTGAEYDISLANAAPYQISVGKTISAIPKGSSSYTHNLTVQAIPTVEVTFDVSALPAEIFARIQSASGFTFTDRDSETQYVVPAESYDSTEKTVTAVLEPLHTYDISISGRLNYPADVTEDVGGSDIVSVGVNDYNLSPSSVTPTSNATQEITLTFERKPRYEVTIQPTSGLTIGLLSDAEFVFTNMHEAGYKYSFTGTDDIYLRNGTYKVEVFNIGEPYTHGTLDYLVINGEDGRADIAFTRATEWDFTEGSRFAEYGSRRAANDPYDGLLISDGAYHRSGLNAAPGCVVQIPVSGDTSISVTGSYNFEFYFQADSGNLQEETTSTGSTAKTDTVTYLYDGGAGYVTLTFTGAASSYITKIEAEPVTVFDLQAAIDAADAGTTITIPEGNIIPEGRIIIDKANLTINGNGARVYAENTTSIAAGRGEGTEDRSVVKVIENASGLIINDLIIENTFPYNNGSNQEADALGVFAENCRFTNVTLKSYLNTLYIDSDASAAFDGCEITGNVYTIYGGGTAYFTESDIITRYSYYRADSSVIVPTGTGANFVFSECTFTNEAYVATASKTLVYYGTDNFKVSIIESALSAMSSTPFANFGGGSAYNTVKRNINEYNNTGVGASTARPQFAKIPANRAEANIIAAIGSKAEDLTPAVTLDDIPAEIKTAHIGVTGESRIGELAYDEDTNSYLINGAGTTLGTDGVTPDTIFAAAMQATGNITLTAKLSDYTAGTIGYAGVFLRESLETDDTLSNYMGTFVDYASGEIRYSKRYLLESGSYSASADEINNANFPYASTKEFYVKLVRTGSKIEWYISNNANFASGGANNMTKISSYDSTLGDTIYAGFFATEGKTLTVSDLRITAHHTDAANVNPESADGKFAETNYSVTLADWFGDADVAIDTPVTGAQIITGVLTFDPTNAAAGTDVTINLTATAPGYENTAAITLSVYDRPTYEYGLMLTEDGLTYNDGLLEEDDTILGGGTYTWDEDTSTLTLTDVDFSTTAMRGLNLGSYAEKLVPEGENFIRVEAENITNGVYGISDLVISGDGSLDVYVNAGVAVAVGMRFDNSAKLTIESGKISITAIGENSNSALEISGTDSLILPLNYKYSTDGGDTVKTFLDDGALTYYGEAKLMIEAIPAPDFSLMFATTVETDETGAAKPGSVETTALYTAVHYEAIPQGYDEKTRLAPNTALDELGGGKYSWDETTKTLTLEDVDFTTAKNVAMRVDYVGDFTINLVGQSKLTALGSGSYAAGIAYAQDITFTGAGTLAIDISHSSSSPNYGLGGDGSKTIFLGGELEIKLTPADDSSPIRGTLVLPDYYEQTEAEGGALSANAPSFTTSDNYFYLRPYGVFPKVVDAVSGEVKPVDIVYDKYSESANHSAQTLRFVPKTGNLFASIDYEDDTALSPSGNYTVSGNAFTFTEDFLETLGNSIRLAFVDNGGYWHSFIVNIINTTPATLTTATAVYNKAVPGSVSFEVNFGSFETIASVKSGDITLAPTTQYAVTNTDTISFTSAFLAGLSVGDTIITITLSSGQILTATITVTDITPGLTVWDDGLHYGDFRTTDPLATSAPLDVLGGGMYGFVKDGDDYILTLSDVVYESDSEEILTSYSNGTTYITLLGDNEFTSTYENSSGSANAFGITALNILFSGTGSLTVDMSGSVTGGGSIALCADGSIAVYGGTLDLTGSFSAMYVVGSLILPNAFNWTADLTNGTYPTNEYTYDFAQKHIVIDTQNYIDPVTAVYDKNADGDDHAAITVSLYPQGTNTLTAVNYGLTPLLLNTDYTEANGEITFSTDFLDTLQTGENTITFDMSGGTDPTLTITVSDSTPSVDPTSDTEETTTEETTTTEEEETTTTTEEETTTTPEETTSEEETTTTPEETTSEEETTTTTTGGGNINPPYNPPPINPPPINPPPYRPSIPGGSYTPGAADIALPPDIDDTPDTPIDDRTPEPPEPPETRGNSVFVNGGTSDVSVTLPEPGDKTAEIVIDGKTIETASLSAAEAILDGVVANLFVTDSGAIAALTKAGDVIAGANITGSLNSNSTIQAIGVAALVSEDIVDIIAGPEVTFVSKGAQERISDVADNYGVDVRLQKKQFADENSGTESASELIYRITLPVERETARDVDLTAEFDTVIVEAAEMAFMKAYGNTDTAAFALTQQESFGTAAAIQVKASALGFEAEPNDTVYVAIFDPESGEFIQVKGIMSDTGFVTFKTVRSGIVIMSKAAFVKQ